MTLSRGLARLLIYTIPVLVSWGAIYLVTRAYQSCNGSDVLATAARLEQFAAIFLLPALIYVAVLVVVVRTSNSSLINRLWQVTAVAMVVAALFVWFRVRYYQLDTATCDSGLPWWWPAWLPAR